MEQQQYQNMINILKSELKVALGCTEPIAIAYAGAKIREILGTMPDSCQIRCSGNIVKNVKGVVVPNSGGLRGIAVAGILGIVGGVAERELAVLEEITEEHQQRTKELLEQDFCQCSLIEGVENLYIIIEASAGEDSALVEIKEYHSNITKIVKNNQVIYEANGHSATGEDTSIDKSQLSLRAILSFADDLNIEDIQPELDRQIQYNSAISSEGLNNSWGVQAGKTLLSHETHPSVRMRARAAAAAGSDARMAGCALPVVINSGSGNQGITLAAPLLIYAEEYHISPDVRYRGLALANLLAVHQKKCIGQLSAYCGVVCAATATACGIAYMLLDGKASFEARYRIMADTITNSICTIGGMVCDGAKSSCATKISIAVETALTSLELAMQENVFREGEGLVMGDVEDTICAVGRMAQQGMLSTDIEILNIMLGK